MIFRDYYFDKIKKFIDKEQIKVITGIRRSGKSTLLRLLENELYKRGINEEQVIYINFESFAFTEIQNASSLYAFVKDKIIKGKRSYLLLDEIQNVEQWEKAINSFKVDFNSDVYITGSNSNLLSSELSTHLAGRFVEIPVFTLSFKEFLIFRKKYLPKKSSSDKNDFNQYIRLGGFPVIHTVDYDLESTYQVVQDIYSSVILKDTVQRNKIRDVELLERVIRYAFDNIGNTFSGKNVADYFKSQHRKVDINTIYNYLNYLEEAFVLYRVSRYDIKGKEILKTQEKYYVSDVSLIHSKLGFRTSQIAGILENIVYLELKRRGYDVFIGKFGEKEIDFIALKQGKKIYIQVAYKLESKAAIDREFANLLAIKDQFPKYVVSMDDFFEDAMSGIKHLYVTDFLLKKDLTN